MGGAARTNYTKVQARIYQLCCSSLFLENRAGSFGCIIALATKRYYYHYYYYYELYSHMTGNDVSDGNKRNVEGSELG